MLPVLVLAAAAFVSVAGSPLSSAETVENSWSTKTPLPLPSWCIVAVNDKIYAIAGTGDYGNASYWNNSVFEYDPALDTWTAKKTMPAERGNIAAAVYQDKIYVIGGSGGLNQVYDPAIDTWENRSSMPTLRTQFEANVVNGKIYIIGGSSGLNEVYDPSTDSWTTKAAMPIGVSGYASAVVDNKIYFMGGSDSDTHNLNQIYDADADTWSFGTPVPTPVISAVAGATSGVLAPKRIYVIGGRVNHSNDGSNFNQVYNPQNDSWMVGAPMPTARFQLRMTVLNDRLYVMEGFQQFGIGAYCLVNEQYTPFGYGTAPPIIEVTSPGSQTYNASSVSLFFIINKPALWTGYSLDGQDNVTISGNATLTGLQNGVHRLVVYANDTLGNMGASATIAFNVDVPFPTALVAAASAASFGIIAVALLVYFKRRKH